ncbi:MAG: sigma-70 family RNA polymerase sigma factor [Verrucomicrobia bacterium]|nr:sigma-70 family RNA polymerase sigma factor [Verrucomicrobiota bacterium]
MTFTPPESEESDEALMHLITVGDERAFRDLVERHQQLVIGTVARMIGSADAEDIAQQVFVNVWKSSSRWRPQPHAKFTTWLLTITKRLVFNESRRRSRTRLIPQSREEGIFPEHPDPSLGPDEQILDAELHRAIESAMATLPEKERMAVILRRHEEMPYEEIAVVLGVSLPSVKSLLFRARTTLKEQLGRYLEG